MTWPTSKVPMKITLIQRWNLGLLTSNPIAAATNTISWIIR